MPLSPFSLFPDRRQCVKPEPWAGLTSGPLCSERMLRRRMWEEGVGRAARIEAESGPQKSKCPSAGGMAATSQWCGLLRPEVRAHIEEL